MTTIILANVYLFKGKICSQLTIKTPKQHKKEDQSNLIDVVLVSLLLTLSIILTFSSAF